MRIPVSGNISTKDGSSNKNARMTNMLAEEKQGKSFAAIRPGLSQVATGSGDGNNLVCFDGNLINIFGNKVYQQVAIGGVGAEYSYNYLPVADYWNHVIWNGSKFCAVGYTYSATSEDGLTWDYGTMPFTALWISVAWNGTIFCAAMNGTGGASPYQRAVATSTDGLTWVTREFPVYDEEDENGIQDICSNGTLFVASVVDSVWDGAGHFLTSTDGITWTPRDCPTQFGGYGALFAYGGGKFVGLTTALGTTYCTTSSDGITWASSTTPSISIYSRPCYINSLFVVGSYNAFQYSSDGDTWNSNSFGGNIICKGVIWDGSKYIAHGYEPVFGGADFSAFSSEDGITWEGASLQTGWWKSSAYNGTNVVMVGNQATFVDPNWNQVTSDYHLINIADISYELEEIGTFTESAFMDVTLIP